MKRSGTTLLSLLLAAELTLVPAWSAGPAAAAAALLPGTPYTTDGSYSVSVPHIIVNQVYGGGDAATTGGYFSNGYIELYNPTDSAVDLSGWSLQYSDPTMNGAWSKLNLNGMIKAHSSYLITDSKGNPAFKSDISSKADQTWKDILFYNKGMKVVLLSSTDLLDTANPFQNKPAGYVDMIGTAGNDSGSVIDGYELDYPTGKTGGTSKQKSVRRADFTDTDNNKEDLRQISFDTLDASALNLMKPHSSSDGSWGVTAPALGVATVSLPAATAGSPYSVSLSVYGGMQPYSFAAAGL
ncbi:lamin tail domain-containing protein, partial [Paenibacillus ihuae]|uniref:lamin tail domain-containing protein n=1 Tax=Paenibacillus ihuae TaxID=1232431 RepID=UPI001FD739AA